MDRLPENLEKKLVKLGAALIDQKRAWVLVEPAQDKPGYWFGGGNMVRDLRDDSLLLIGRFRAAGDSRVGLAQGPRGRELAILRSQDHGRSFAKVHSWDKSDLYCKSAVLSIEGSALRLNKRRVEVLVSTEKVRPYPRRLTAYQKPGTGTWSIDTFAASSLERLNPQDNIRPLLSRRRMPAPAGVPQKRRRAFAGVLLRGGRGPGLWPRWTLPPAPPPQPARAPLCLARGHRLQSLCLDPLGRRWQPLRLLAAFGRDQGPAPGRIPPHSRPGRSDPDLTHGP